MNFSPSSVLVVRLSSLGDVILTAPALESIKAAWPGCRVSLLVKDRYADVFAAHPAVDEILSFESRGLWGWLAEFRRRPFDVYVDLHDTWRSRVWGAFGKFSRRTRYDKRAWERRRLVWTKRP
jgi:ADP-heptose:LPS heptosyltransferase